MNNLLNLARMIQIAGDNTESNAVKEWARKQGKAYLLAYTVYGK